MGKSRFENFLPACVKCKNLMPDVSGNISSAKCSVFGDIPEKYLQMDDACDKLNVDLSKALLDVGNRPLTMLERWAMDAIE